MKTVKMSYKGFVFKANPTEIKTEFSRKTASRIIPFKHSGTGVICQSPAVIKGRGKFCGEGERAQAQSLYSVFKKEGAAYLFSPVFVPVKAHFTNLEFSVNSEKECIEYAFTFTQEENLQKGSFDFGYTLAAEGENLFDVAGRTHTPIEKIIDLNRFKNPFSVREGDRIWLK